MRKTLLVLLRLLSFTLFLVVSAGLHAQGSISWGSAMDVAPNNYQNLHPRVAVDAAGDPVVIWGRSSDESVFISRWNGAAFSTPAKVNPTGYTVATQSWMGPDIAAQGDSVFVVFKRTPEASDTNHVFILRSTDGGTSFGNPVQVDAIADSISRFPTLDVDPSGNPVVAFMKFDPSFGNARWVVAKSMDGGNSFATDRLASGWSGGTVCDCCPGSVVTDGSNVCVSYRDNLNNIRDTWTGISTDGGGSFSQGMPIDQGNWMLMNCPSTGPDGIIQGDSLHAVFMSQETGNPLVYRSASSISQGLGAYGTPIIGTRPGVTSQNFPRIASFGTAAAIVWRQNFNMNAQIPILFTNNLQDGFPADYDSVFNGNGMSAVVNVDIAMADGKVHVVWQNDATGTVKYRSGTFTPFVGTEQPQAIGIQVYPNPSSGAVNLSVSGLEGLDASEFRLSLFSSSGQVERNWELVLPDLRLELEGLSPGIYFLRLRSSEGGIASKKLVVLPR